jgi:hypothetical protein
MGEESRHLNSLLFLEYVSMQLVTNLIERHLHRFCVPFTQQDHESIGYLNNARQFTGL